MGESSSEALELVPAHIKVIKTIHPKYTCRRCERNGVETVVKIALMPATLIPKSITTPSYSARSSRVNINLACIKPPRNDV